MGEIFYRLKIGILHIAAKGSARNGQSFLYTALLLIRMLFV